MLHSNTPVSDPYSLAQDSMVLVEFSKPPGIKFPIIGKAPGTFGQGRSDSSCFASSLDLFLKIRVYMAIKNKTPPNAKEFNPAVPEVPAVVLVLVALVVM